MEELRRKPGAAQRAYDAAVLSDPTHPVANVGVGRIFLQQGNMHDALTRFTALLNVELDEEISFPIESGDKSWELQAKLGATEALLAMDRVEEAHQTLAGLAEELDGAVSRYGNVGRTRTPDG